MFKGYSAFRSNVIDSLTVLSMLDPVKCDVWHLLENKLTTDRRKSEWKNIKDVRANNLGKRGSSNLHWCSCLSRRSHCFRHNVVQIEECLGTIQPIRILNTTDERLITIVVIWDTPCCPNVNLESVLAVSNEYVRRAVSSGHNTARVTSIFVWLGKIFHRPNIASFKYPLIDKLLSFLTELIICFSQRNLSLLQSSLQCGHSLSVFRSLRLDHQTLFVYGRVYYSMIDFCPACIVKSNLLTRKSLDTESVQFMVPLAKRAPQ